MADVIAALDAAYPPQLAHDWDSVGLVCGDPGEPVESVTIAVDATEAVVDEVPERGLLLAHHPLLLRGVDTVAADTAKGALIHRLIRTGRALFTAHTNADAASPGVSDALAEALGLTVDARAVAGGVGSRSGQMGGVRAGLGRDDGARGAVRRGRRAHRRLLALQLERGRNRTVPAARRRHPGHRRGGHRRAGVRGPGGGDRARHGCARPSCPPCGPRIPTRSLPSTSSPWPRFPVTWESAGSASWTDRSRCRSSHPGASGTAGDLMGRADLG